MPPGFLEIQVTNLTCELTIVPPEPWPVIQGRGDFQPVSAKITLVKRVGYPWTGDSIEFRGFSMVDGGASRPGIAVYRDCLPVFAGESFRWAITYASNRWEEVGIGGQQRGCRDGGEVEKTS